MTLKKLKPDPKQTIVKRRAAPPPLLPPPPPPKPLILAPAGNPDTFLAALAAGADAIYCGLKQMSARMAAINFTVPELAALAALAREKTVKLLVTVNTLMTAEELDVAGRMIVQLQRDVKPDALIVQDLAAVRLARQAGFTGEIHLSTLANVTFPGALELFRDGLNVQQVIIPREIHIDEVRQMAAACPPGLGLEIFVHGALCYGVSGRCYWSSYMGGKSGLRGRCVQPCRRFYAQGGVKGKLFSCMDLSLDVLVKVLLGIPQIRAWKIEGRKKGPHYVYHTVRAYRLLRDNDRDPEAKKEALHLLENALGRPTTHYGFLPQKQQNPVSKDGRTGSGLFVGKVLGGGSKAFVNPRIPLLRGDLLRIGYEDESWHGTQRVGKSVPKPGRLQLNSAGSRGPDKGAPVFLVDRMEPELAERLESLSRRLAPVDASVEEPVRFQAELPQVNRRKAMLDNRIVLGNRSGFQDVMVFRHPVKQKDPGAQAYWLSRKTVESTAKKTIPRLWWWTPPVIWPDDEKSWQGLIDQVIALGARRFVLNAPWQTVLFRSSKNLDLWAGPFCNAGNPLAIGVLADLGFNGAIVNPELGQQEILSLPGQSVLPLGVVGSGLFPLCISRVLGENVRTETAFTSPRQEGAWVNQHDGNYWVFPNWRLDLTKHRKTLQAAGYRLFVHLKEPIPKGVEMKARPGLWNWEVGLR